MKKFVFLPFVIAIIILMFLVVGSIPFFSEIELRILNICLSVLLIISIIFMAMNWGKD